MIPVGWLAPGDQWDCNLVQRLLDGTLYPHGIEAKHHTGYPNTDGCVLVVPGRYWTPERVNEAIGRYRWLLLFRTSDEEDTFDVDQLEHPNMKCWVQTPRRDYSGARVFGVGLPPHLNDLPADPPAKTLDVFLSAQRTNGRPGRHFRVYERRAGFFKVLKRGAWASKLVERDGFAQGDRGEYVAGMLAAKVAPAPTGTVSVDSFRFWEALETHAVPIADTVSPADGETDYWARLFPDAPFPTVTDYAELPGKVDDVLADWPVKANRVAAWWCRQKRQMAMNLKTDLEGLGAI